MGYVQAGYSIVLGILFLYAVSLLWRRRRVTRTVERVMAAGQSATARGDSGGATP
jgi:uncharacterized protein (TIGR03382 family)